MAEQGFIISFAGLDGSGKSTYVDFTYQWLKDHSERNIIISGAMKPSKFHGQLKNTAKVMGKNVRDIYDPELIGVIHAVDLINNLEETIIPAIDKGDIVVTHRYDICALAYSRAVGHKSKTIEKILSLCPEPRLYFYLDVSVGVALERIRERSLRTGVPISTKENFDLLSRAHENYKEIIEAGSRKIIVINTEREVEQVKMDISNELQNLFKCEGQSCVRY